MTLTVTVPRYMAYDEGCIECEEPSGVIGFYGSPEDAAEAVRAAERHQAADWHGEHRMHVIDLANPQLSEHGA